jgi:hypothetical protein
MRSKCKGFWAENALPRLVPQIQKLCWASVSFAHKIVIELVLLGFVLDYWEAKRDGFTLRTHSFESFLVNQIGAGVPVLRSYLNNTSQLQLRQVVHRNIMRYLGDLFVSSPPSVKICHKCAFVHSTQKKLLQRWKEYVMEFCVRPSAECKDGYAGLSDRCGRYLEHLLDSEAKKLLGLRCKNLA